VLRFGSTRVLQAAVDAKLVSLEEALAQACRREPSIFLQLLEVNIDALDRGLAARVRDLAPARHRMVPACLQKIYDN
jgi:hypothetical protein